MLRRLDHAEIDLQTEQLHVNPECDREASKVERCIIRWWNKQNFAANSSDFSEVIPWYGKIEIRRFYENTSKGIFARKESIKT